MIGVRARRRADDTSAWPTMLALAALLLGACATTGHAPTATPYPAFALAPAERRLLATVRGDFDLVTRRSADAVVLRRRAREVPPTLDLTDAARRLEQTMRRARGVGVAGPQVGLGLRVAVLLLGYRGPTPRAVFVRNPVLLERSDETGDSYEGCLSVPDVGGLVRRHRWVRVRYLAADGREVEQRAVGPDAVLWQHELDHLDGALYLDRLRGELMPIAEMRRRRDALEALRQPASAPAPNPAH